MSRALDVEPSRGASRPAERRVGDALLEVGTQLLGVLVRLLYCLDDLTSIRRREGCRRNRRGSYQECGGS